jgi:hypothetical protein
MREIQLLENGLARFGDGWYRAGALRGTDPLMDLMFTRAIGVVNGFAD